MAPISTSANLGFEDKLWAAADKLRGNMDADKERGFRARHGETLFIDGRKLGELTDRVHRELTKNLEALGYGE